MTTLAPAPSALGWHLNTDQEISLPVTEDKPRDTDALLVKQAVDGNRRAFDFLVVKYQHRVAALVQRYVRQPADVRDITQETFIRAWQALPRFRHDSAFYTWLYRIAVNTALKHVDRKSPAINATDLDSARSFDDWLQEHGAHAGPEADQAVNELASIVQQAIRELPEDMREALHYREWQGMSYQAIAEELRIPVGTVRSRIFRAREAVELRIKAWRNGEEIE